MLNALSRFIREDDGLETVEWAIVGGLIVLAGAAIFQTIGGDVNTALGNLQTQTAAAAGAGGGGTGTGTGS